ncbi:16S rRNA (cytosine(1402)-N(4))-methyltransferase RsmH [Hyphomicrobium sp.]|jgi:16S rRNA (cytosine1402-N4)-methyltransferase|uniref:16S rRNA (cytosine(1402)-N(4))-methyltransferase RsmH n=1 Tax=Hyphomicrobium sp. TaxID=82 RepID=UPI0035685DC9
MTRGGGAEGASLGPADKHPRHIPVLVSEVLETLAPKDGEIYIDGTFGAGGYTRAILGAAECSVLALDRDPNAIRDSAALVAQLGGRLKIAETPFSQMEDAVGSELPGQLVDGVVLDIGVSSMQLDDAERGFSFQSDGPLDMRMSSSGMSAADFLNTAEDEEIANVIYTFGEEHRSRAIARAIVKRRDETPFSRTLELADIVLRVFHGRKVDGRHPATRTFQALRIFVNDELGELAHGLAAAERVLKPGGRLVVVSFHSLEDRIVKKFLTERSGKTPGGSRHLPPELIKSGSPSFRLVNSRPLTPSKGELEVNPRSRSARLRAAVRTDAAAWPLDMGAMGVPEHRR